MKKPRLLYYALGLIVTSVFWFPSSVTAQPFAYVPNCGDNTISVIDTTIDTVVATVSGPCGFGVAVNPAGTRVYLATDPNFVSVFDTASNTVIATVSVGADPEGVAVTPDGTRVYVANSQGATVSVIDAATNTVIATVAVGEDPVGVAVNPTGTRVYVAEGASRNVSVIDTTTNSVIATVLVGDSNNGPNGIVVTPDGARVYVTVNNLGIKVIDTSSNSVIATVLVGPLPRGVAVTPDGTKVYVTNTGNKTVSVIETTTNTVMATVSVGNNPFGVAVTPDGMKVYVVNSGTVSVIDTGSNMVIATITVGNDTSGFGQFIRPVQTCVDPLPGLVSWWPGDGNANDIAGNNHGTLQGGMGFAPGMVGQAFILDGVDDYVQVPEVNELDGFPELTIDAWINLNTVGSNPEEDVAIIVSKYDNLVENGLSYYLAVRPPGVLQLTVFQICCLLGSSIWAGMISNDPVIPIGEFVHVAGVWKGGDVFELYVDGIQVPGTVGIVGGVPAFMNNTDRPVFIGAAQSTNIFGHVDGIIDEVEVYNRALSSSEIQAIFAAGSAGKCEPFQFSGFFQPVDNPPTINVANAGSAVPVKFSLNGDQGLDIFETSYPKSQAIACDTTSPVDVLEETTTAGSSSLSYDASTDQYTYVWKTNKMWANTCRQLVVELNDGSSHVANFKFKK